MYRAAELKKLAEKKYNWWNPVELSAEAINYVSKYYVFPIDHLTTDDSQKMCAGILYFNPLNQIIVVRPILLLIRNWNGIDY